MYALGHNTSTANRPGSATATNGLRPAGTGPAGRIILLTKRVHYRCTLLEELEVLLQRYRLYSTGKYEGATRILDRRSAY